MHQVGVRTRTHTHRSLTFTNTLTCHRVIIFQITGSWLFLFHLGIHSSAYNHDHIFSFRMFFYVIAFVHICVCVLCKLLTDVFFTVYDKKNWNSDIKINPQDGRNTTKPRLVCVKQTYSDTFTSCITSVSTVSFTSPESQLTELTLFKFIRSNSAPWAQHIKVNVMIFRNNIYLYVYFCFKLLYSWYQEKMVQMQSLLQQCHLFQKHNYGFKLCSFFSQLCINSRTLGVLNRWKVKDKFFPAPE